MGSSYWSNDAYSTLRTSYSTKSDDDIFTNTKANVIASDMSPFKLKFRECRDSDAHPNTLAVDINLDETGSMGDIPKILVRDKLGTLMNVFLKHGLPDVQVLFNCIGDHYSDKNYLQVGQFESGTDELNKWLTSAVLERNGGGQGKESYLLAWLVAARHTSIDCFEKRGVKGILFTIGDEMCWETVESDTIKKLMGYDEGFELKAKEILAEAQKSYHVFHIHINHTYNSNSVIEHWKQLLGERVIVTDNYEEIAEIIGTTVALINGIDMQTVLSSFDSKTAGNVKNALAKVNTTIAKPTAQKGVITL